MSAFLRHQIELQITLCACASPGSSSIALSSPSEMEATENVLYGCIADPHLGHLGKFCVGPLQTLHCDPPPLSCDYEYAQFISHCQGEDQLWRHGNHGKWPWCHAEALRRWSQQRKKDNVLIELSLVTRCFNESRWVSIPLPASASCSWENPSRDREGFRDILDRPCAHVLSPWGLCTTR